jgi:hypothetical protein
MPLTGWLCWLLQWGHDGGVVEESFWVLFFLG